MTSKSLVVVGILMGFASIPVLAQQDRQMGEIGIRVFEDIAYGGLNATFRRDTPDLRSSGLDKQISSLRVAPGEIWEVCEGRSYTGRCRVFSGNEPDLRKRGWNDVISSLRRVRGGQDLEAEQMRPPASGGLELYAGTQYSGQRKVVSGSVRDLRSIDFNDRAVSVRVPRGQVWEVCVSADYDDCRVVDRNYPDLSVLGVSRLVSSVRRRSGGRGTYPPVSEEAELVLYDREDFAGRSVTIDRSRSSLGSFSNRARSVEVIRGRWELCDQAAFSGRCIVITRSVPDLATIGFGDRISSVRPR